MKNRQTGPKPKMFAQRKGNSQQSEKTIYRKRKNIYKLHIIERVSV